MMHGVEFSKGPLVHMVALEYSDASTRARKRSSLACTSQSHSEEIPYSGRGRLYQVTKYDIPR
jgi:hypothetical protein